MGGNLPRLLARAGALLIEPAYLGISGDIRWDIFPSPIGRTSLTLWQLAEFPERAITYEVLFSSKSPVDHYIEIDLDKLIVYIIHFYYVEIILKYLPTGLPSSDQNILVFAVRDTA
jgi:hypothetical protein